MANILSGTTLTTSNTNVSHSIWSTTSTNTAYTPNIGNQFIYNGPTISATPFSMTFSWDGKDVSVSLKNGNDIFKITKLLTEVLDKNNIEYNLKTRKRK